MNIKYPQLIIRLSIWLAAEIVMGWVGVDDLADYDEYLKKLKQKSLADERIVLSQPYFKG